MKESSRIWNELNMAKQYTSNIAKYTSRQRQTNEIIDVIIVSLSILSIAGFYIQNWIPIIGVVISLVWKYAKKIIPFFRQDDKDLVELDALHTFYESYVNRLEHFWYLHITEQIDDKVLMSLFFREKESEANKKANLNVLLKKINESDNKEAQQETEEYLNQVYKSDESNEQESKPESE